MVDRERIGVNPPATTGDTVTVACKLPNGLLLQCCVMEEAAEPIFGGGTRTVRRARRLPQTYTVEGPSPVWAMAGQLANNNGRVLETIPGGYALTPGIPRDFWELWLEQNKDSDLVRNRVIFAQSNQPKARDQAKEQEKVLSGLEPIDREAPGKRLGNPRLQTYNQQT